MKTSTSATGLFFCALLCTSFAHDWLAGQDIATQARFRKTNPKALTKSSGIQKRTLPSDLPLSFCYNPVNGCIALCNVAQNVCIIINISLQICGVFNGVTGAAVVISLTANTGRIIPSGCWNHALLSFNAYLATIVSLTAFLSIGTAFTVATIPALAVTIIASVMVHLSADIAIDIGININLCVGRLITVCLQICLHLTGNLNVILSLSVGVIVCFGDLLWFEALLNGLVNLFLSASISLTLIIGAGVVLNLGAILGSSNGVACLTIILTACGLKFDLFVLFGANINNQLLILQLIVQLGGNLTYGITGCINVILNIVNCKNGSITLQALIQIILQFAVYATVTINISILFSALVTLCGTQNTTYGNSGNLTLFLALCTNIVGNVLVLVGINLSAVLTLCVAGAVAGILVLVIRILILLIAIASNVICISTLVLVVLQLLNTTRGCILIQICIPSLVIGVNIYANGNILSLLLNGVISLLLVLLLPIVTLLTSLTVVASIYAAISVAVTTATGGSKTLSGCLNDVSCLPIRTAIRALIGAVV